MHKHRLRCMYVVESLGTRQPKNSNPIGLRASHKTHTQNRRGPTHGKRKFAPPPVAIFNSSC